jgi:hypothetical protein
MGGSTTTNQNSTTQSQQVQQLPPWINDAAQQNYAFAQNVATRPLQQYQGQMVADISPQMQQAFNAAAAGGNAGADQYAAAQAGFQGVLGQTPPQLSSTDLSPYMNPYTQDVINKTLPIMQQQLGQQQAQGGANATQAGAFGGSRLGVQQGVTQAQGAQNMAQMAAQLNQANFGQAQQGAEFDINQAMNQSALNLQASSGLAGLGNQAQLNQARNFTELMTAGSAEQQQAQNQINAQIAKFQQAWAYPYQQTGVLQSALGMTPYGSATLGQSNTQGQTTTESSPNFASLALGGLSTLGSLFPLSDRRLKTDIKRIDTHPTGLPIYSYRYKGDPKTYPKIAGPMAEDVAKIAPHAVRPMGVGGRLAVHMPTLDALGGGAPGMGAAMMGQGPRTGPGGGIGPSMGAGISRGLGIGSPSPAIGPGALAGGGPAGATGALGAAFGGPPMRRRGMPKIPIAGALGV